MTTKRRGASGLALGLAGFAAGVLSAGAAHAIKIGGAPIPFMPVQKVTQIPAVFCNFVTGQPTVQGGAKGCQNQDGNYSVVNGADILHLDNQQNLANKKFVLLSITLTAAGAQGLAPIVDQFPTLTPTYVPAQAGTTTPFAESWVPALDLLQFEWTIFPQPASEDVQLNSFNVRKNGVVTPFDVAWIFSTSLQSHCPEPATWAMMIVGIGLVGCTLRRQRVRGAAGTLA
jgi:hypothetical protein